MKPQLRWLTLGLLICVACVYLFPFSTWYFDIDDCGVIWNSRFTSFTDFLLLFIKGKDGVGLCFPSNYSMTLSDCRPFLNSIHSFYRPLTLIFFGIQYYFFGAFAYPYFFIMILFHACNVALLFLIVQSIYPSLFWSAIASLFFGFHISYWGWMGWIAAQPYTISLCLLLAATIFFIRYLQKQQLLYGIFSCICYGVAVFLFEFTFVYPLFISSLWIIYPTLMQYLKLPRIHIKQYIRSTGGLWFTALIFLITRTLICSSTHHNSTHFIRESYNFLCWLSTRNGDYLSLIIDLANLSFITSGNRLLKGGLVVFLGSCLLYLFIKSPYKKIILFCICNIGLFLWPAILKQYTLRYLYYALPFFALIILLLVNPLKNKRLGICWIAMIFFNSYFVINKMKERTQDLKVKTDALHNLVRHQLVQRPPLCFVALPKGPFASGLAQHLWMLGFEASLPIFYDPSTFTEFNKQVTNADITITREENNLYLQSNNTNNIWWLTFGGENMRLGKKDIHATDDCKVSYIRYVLDASVYNHGLCFITWDYEKHLFKYF